VLPEQQPERPSVTVCVWPRPFDWLFDWVAVFDAGAQTLLPLFWLTSPALKKALLPPLVTTGAEVAVWSALFSPVFDCRASWLTSPFDPEQQLEPPATDWVWPRPFDWSFDWVALFEAGAQTLLPLFWLTVSPLPPPHGVHELPQPFPAATFGPLTTTGADLAVWFAVLLPELDWSADCDVSPEWLEQHELPPSATVWL